MGSMGFRRCVAAVTFVIALASAARVSAQEPGSETSDVWDEGRTVRLHWGLGLIAVAGAALVGQAGVVVKQNKLQDDLDEWRQMVPSSFNSCKFANMVKGTSQDSEDAARARGTCDKADRLRPVGWALFGVWFVSLGAGLGLVLHSVLSDGEDASGTARVDLLPTVGPQGGALHLRWRY